jgi:RND family efflux transporter MFP subunit
LVSSCTKEEEREKNSLHSSTAPETIILKSSYPNGILHLPGELFSYEVVDIYAKLPGFIEKINVDRGSVVENGDILITISAPEHMKNLEEALAKYELENWHHERLKKAAETPGSISQLELETAQKIAESLEKAAQGLKDIKDYLVIKAPFSGIVSTRYLHPGAFVGLGSDPKAIPIIRLENIRTLRLVVYIPQTHVDSIREGMNVEFVDSAYPLKTFSAKVSLISHALDPKTRTEAVELEVDNSNLLLSPGSYIDVLWPLSRPYPTYLVPSSAVVTNTYRSFVIRIQSGVVEWIDVKRGIQYGNLIEIFGPLHEGDVLVVKATDELRPGVEIESSKKPIEN